MAEHATRRCAPKTAERYQQLGEYAVRHFGSTLIDRLGSMDLETAFNALHDHGGQVSKNFPAGKPLSARTVRHVAFLVHGCLEKAVRWQLINRNPMDSVDLPRFVKTEPKVLDKSRIAEVLSHAKTTRLFPLLVLAASTGARRGELLALTWSDIDFGTGVMEISKSLEQTDAGLRIKSTKSTKPRRFSVPAGALAVLEEHRVEQDRCRELYGADYQDADLVFCRPDGAYYVPDRIGARVSELMAKAGLKGATLHSLRHSHASELLSQHIPIPAISKRLGHAGPHITMSIYAHAMEADELAAAQIWDDALGDTITANRRTPEDQRMLANVSGKFKKGLQLIEKKKG